MTIRIYDFDDNAVKIENPDKPIKRIDAIILSGDETGTIWFEDGTRFDFDALDDRDTELEYIESSGTQYMDTKVVPNNKGGECTILIRTGSKRRRKPYAAELSAAKIDEEDENDQ